MQETRQPYSRRDVLLQQMGISQWQLVRPEALKGAMNITVAEHYSSGDRQSAKSIATACCAGCVT